MEDTEAEALAKLQDLDRFWNPEDAAGSETALRSLLPAAQRLAAKDRGQLIELHAMIARAEGQQQKLAQARSSIEHAEALWDAERAVCTAATRIRWLVERGRLHILEKTPSQARILFSEAWTLAINSGEDYFAVEIAHLMSVTEPPKAQQAWLARAIETAERSPLPKSKSWLGRLYTSLGWKLFDVRQHDKALDAFRDALRHLKASGTPREAFLAQWAIGKVLRAQGKTAEALAIQESLLAGVGAGEARDGRLYEELAECLQTLQRTAEAQSYFERAYRELSEDTWVKDNQPRDLKRMKDLGKVKP